MTTLFMKNFVPLTSHQTGIKIKNQILNSINQEDLIILDFEGVEICTDSFMQQLTTVLSHEISFSQLRKKIKYVNLNDFLKELVKSKLFLASKEFAA
ncbi:MAG: STAS-like domain-containing protein [Epsilonproteobacteria bacterium]|nr:STAS-like domain-containing protein [Campylobacterota bacterium]